MSVENGNSENVANKPINLLNDDLYYPKPPNDEQPPINNIIESGNLGEYIEAQILGDKIEGKKYYHYTEPPIIDVFKATEKHSFIYCPFCMCVGKKFYPVGKLTTLKQPYKHQKKVIHRITKDEIDHTINDEDGTFNSQLYRCKNHKHGNLGRFGGKIKLDYSITCWENSTDFDNKAVFC
jgi:hypothetical protein